MEENLGKRILLVEDDTILADLIKMELEWQNHQVQWCPNGKEAIDHLEKANFDVLLTDLYMPDIDGLELVKWVKANKNMDHIIVVSATPGDEVEKMVANNSIRACFKKPLNQTAITQLLHLIQTN